MVPEEFKTLLVVYVVGVIFTFIAGSVHIYLTRKERPWRDADFAAFVFTMTVFLWPIAIPALMMVKWISLLLNRD